MRTRVLVVALTALALAGCAADADRVAYEDAVATASVEKARRFFERYPHSKYREPLADALIRACDKDDVECGRLLLSALPRDDRRYAELRARYDAPPAERAR